MQKKKRNLIFLISLMFVIVAIIIGVSGFNDNVSSALFESAKENLTDSTVQQQKSINSDLTKKSENILAISQVLQTIGDDKERMLMYLETIQKFNYYDNIMVFDTEGRGIMLGGEPLDLNPIAYFKEAIPDVVTVTEPYMSPYTNSYVVAASTPIMNQDEMVGMVLITYDVEYLIEVLSIYTNELGYSIISDENGSIFMTTGIDDVSIRDLEEAIFDKDSQHDVWVEDFKEGQSGQLSYTLHGKKMIAEYRPLSINDWMIIYSVSEEAILTNVQNISHSMVVLSGVIIAGALLFIIYIYISKKKSLLDIEKVAFYDELTGLPNLVKLKLDIQDVLSKDDGLDYVIVKFDVDNFKVINEMFNFEVGNSVLRAIAETGSTVTDPTFRIGRIGGDQFILFSSTELLGNLEEIRFHYESIFKNRIPELRNHRFSFSYGRYFIHKGETDVNDIINKVTLAHNFSKKSPNHIIWDYDDRFKEQVLAIASITNKMEDALKQKEFKVFLQPKFDLRANGVAGAEALVRWIDSDGEMIFPDVFIPLFESNGFIVELDKYMLASVCSMIKGWLDAGYKVIPISVNFSRVHLSNPNFVDELKAIVDSYNIATQYIEIELTETTITDNEELLEELLRNLHKGGFKVSIDDFGAGYSSLGMLKNFKVDTLKLDRSFFVNNEETERGGLVIEGIVRLARNLHMTIVAEGVEEAEQVEFLRKIQCEYAQGYFYERPINHTLFEEKYLK